MSERKLHSRSGHRVNDDANEDDEWLFESIVAYLSSPIWSIPIQHFIETNCMIFSPTDGWSGSVLLEEDEEHDTHNIPSEYIQVHLKYKDLVDALINTFLQDIGVSYNKFVRACKNSEHLRQHPVYIELFEQIWCAENFKMFKSQMVKKNIELELQALILLQYQLGIVGADDEKLQPNQDDHIMAVVIRKSKDEYDELLNSRQRIDNSNLPIKKPQDLETAKKIVKSENIVENLKSELDQQEYLNKKIVRNELYSENSQANSRNDRPMSAAKSRNEHETYNFEKMRLDESTPGSSSAKIVNNLAQAYLASEGNNTASEIQRRADFMQKQRELLNEKKRLERQKQLDKFMNQSKENGEFIRPMSSRAARSVLAGAEPSDIEQAHLSSKSEEEKKKLEARKALAETLRKEVINNSSNSSAKK